MLEHYSQVRIDARHYAPNRVVSAVGIATTYSIQESHGYFAKLNQSPSESPCQHSETGPRVGIQPVHVPLPSPGEILEILDRVILTEAFRFRAWAVRKGSSLLKCPLNSGLSNA